MAEGKTVLADDLDLPLDDEEDDDILNIKAAREQIDRKVIRRALARSEGNISTAAKILGVSRPTLYDLLKQYSLQPASEKA
jgi:two-component system NtrC family response regulator